MSDRSKLSVALRRSAVIVAILLISVAVGFVYQAVWDRIDRGRYPREYSEYVSKYSSECGVPEYIIYSVINVESGFDSSAVSSAGAVGLMQITPDTFDFLMLLTKESLQHGMLYDPETNIKYGTHLLAYLYAELEDWDAAFAAYNAGINRVKGWLENPEYTDENGKLVNIPIEETRAYVPKVKKNIEEYKRLYYK